MARFHRYGPWVVAGAAIFAALAVEAARSHRISREQVLFFVVLVPSIVLHEVSHGAVANLCGDDTAKVAGRLTLNPLKHVDVIGTIILPILLIFTTGSAFGYAKPVPISVNKLNHPRNQAVLVGLAGPATNIVLALIGGFALRIVTHDGVGMPGVLDSWPIGDELLFLFGYANVIIAAFNLIPIPPLDGSAVVERLLPTAMLPQYYRLRSLSMVLVLALVFLAPGALNTVFNHALTIWERIVFPS